MEETLVVVDNIDPRDLIKEHLDKGGRKYTWLAKEIDISFTYMSKILLKRRPLQEGHRQKINEVLNTNF